MKHGHSYSYYPTTNILRWLSFQKLNLGPTEDSWDFAFGLREVKVDYCSALVGFTIFGGWDIVLGVEKIQKIYST